MPRLSLSLLARGLRLGHDAVYNALLEESLRAGCTQPETFVSLHDRIAALDISDPEVFAPVDIGLPDTRKTHGTPKKKWAVNTGPVEKNRLLDAAVTKTLLVDLDQVKRDWENDGLLNAVYMSATHYGVYKDLYRHGFFVPRVPLRVFYPHHDDTLTPVHRGNILTASEAYSVPEVSFNSDSEDMWTLVLTNPDGHLNDNEAEYVHWLVRNIKGGDLSTGEEIVPYLPPFPLRGTGYHRMVFVLYKQDKGHVQFDFPTKIKHRYSLKERTFKTFDFYKAHQDFITPAGLCFCQVTWDSTVTDFFHNELQMREPVYEYMGKPKELPPQLKFPSYKSFNRYLDRYRDPKEMRQEVLLKRLATLNPFKEEPPMPKYPNLHMKPNLPSWLLANQWKENNRIGRFKDLRPHSIYEQKEFDYYKDMYHRKAGDKPQS